jgi:hypothetical protein
VGCCQGLPHREHLAALSGVALIPDPKLKNIPVSILKKLIDFGREWKNFGPRFTLDGPERILFHRASPSIATILP